MNVKKKKIYLSFMMVILMSIMVVPTNALAEQSTFQESSMIMPRLTYIELAEADLTIKNGVATVDCWVNGDMFTATKAKVIAELQLKSGSNWIAYGTWTDTQNDYEASVYESKSVKAGQTYRVKATYTVWEGSQSETIVVFSDEVTA